MSITTASDNKVLIGLSHGAEEPENVLIAYLMGVEALRAGKEAVMWLTKHGVEIAVDGAADGITVPGGPSIADLHEEYVTAVVGSSLRIHLGRGPRLQLLSRDAAGLDHVRSTMLSPTARTSGTDARSR